MILLEYFIKASMALWVVLAAMLVFEAMNHNPSHADVKMTVPDGDILL